MRVFLAVAALGAAWAASNANVLRHRRGAVSSSSTSILAHNADIPAAGQLPDAARDIVERVYKVLEHYEKNPAVPLNEQMEAEVEPRFSGQLIKMDAAAKLDPITTSSIVIKMVAVTAKAAAALAMHKVSVDIELQAAELKQVGSEMQAGIEELSKLIDGAMGDMNNRMNESILAILRAMLTLLSRSKLEKVFADAFPTDPPRIPLEANGQKDITALRAIMMGAIQADFDALRNLAGPTLDAAKEAAVGRHVLKSLSPNMEAMRQLMTSVSVTNIKQQVAKAAKQGGGDPAHIKSKVDGAMASASRAQLLTLQAAQVSLQMRMFKGANDALKAKLADQSQRLEAEASAISDRLQGHVDDFVDTVGEMTKAGGDYIQDQHTNSYTDDDKTTYNNPDFLKSGDFAGGEPFRDAAGKENMKYAKAIVSWGVAAHMSDDLTDAEKKLAFQSQLQVLDFIGFAVGVINAGSDLVEVVRTLFLRSEKFVLRHQVGIASEHTYDTLVDARHSVCIMLRQLLDQLTFFANVDTTQVPLMQWEAMLGEEAMLLLSDISESDRRALRVAIHHSLCSALSPMRRRILAYFRNDGFCTEIVPGFKATHAGPGTYQPYVSQAALNADKPPATRTSLPSCAHPMDIMDVKLVNRKDVGTMKQLGYTVVGERLTEPSNANDKTGLVFPNEQYGELNAVVSKTVGNTRGLNVIARAYDWTGLSSKEGSTLEGQCPDPALSRVLMAFHCGAGTASLRNARADQDALIARLNIPRGSPITDVKVVARTYGDITLKLSKQLKAIPSSEQLAEMTKTEEEERLEDAGYKLLPLFDVGNEAINEVFVDAGGGLRHFKEFMSRHVSANVFGTITTNAHHAAMDIKAGRSSDYPSLFIYVRRDGATPLVSLALLPLTQNTSPEFGGDVSSNVQAMWDYSDLYMMDAVKKAQNGAPNLSTQAEFRKAFADMRKKQGKPAEPRPDEPINMNDITVVNHLWAPNWIVDRSAAHAHTCRITSDMAATHDENDSQTGLLTRIGRWMKNWKKSAWSEVNKVTLRLKLKTVCDRLKNTNYKWSRIPMSVDEGAKNHGFRGGTRMRFLWQLKRYMDVPLPDITPVHGCGNICLLPPADRTLWDTLQTDARGSFDELEHMVKTGAIPNAVAEQQPAASPSAAASAAAQTAGTTGTSTGAGLVVQTQNGKGKHIAEQQPAASPSAAASAAAQTAGTTSTSTGAGLVVQTQNGKGKHIAKKVRPWK